MLKHNLRRSANCLLLLLLVLGAVGCAANDSSSRSAGNVVLFAAASTADALDHIKEQFQQQTGLRVRTSYAGTSTLAQQIVSGADADVFVSANVEWVDYLEKEGLVARRRNLLGNRLVIVTPADAEIEMQQPEDLLGAEIEHLALADTEAVPAGIYSREALTKLDLWEQLKEKVVTGANVRQALSYVETGAAEAGIVYATDAAISRLVRVAVTIPPEATPPIRYPVVLTKQGESTAAGRSFYEYLISPQATQVFKQHGFIVRTDL